MKLSQEEIENLSSLLLSADDANTKLGFAILNGRAIPSSLLTELFVVYKMTPQKELREEALDLLQKLHVKPNDPILTSDIRLSSKKNVHPTEQTIKKNISRYVQMSSGKLDGLKLALAMYNKYGTGLNYLLDNLPMDLQKKLAERFIVNGHFSLQNCTLTKVPEVLYQFENLKGIDLSNNKLKTLPRKMKVFKELEVLNVSSNRLTKLGTYLKEFTKLRELNISSNNFKEFPSVVCEIQSLESLNIYKLRLLYVTERITIPDAFKNLKNMRHLTFCEGTYGYSQGLAVHFSNYPNFSSISSKDGTPIDLLPHCMAERVYRENGKSEGVLFLFEQSDNTVLKKQIIEEQFYDPVEKKLDFKSTLLTKFPQELLDYEVEILNLSDCYLGIKEYQGRKGWVRHKEEEMNQLLSVFSHFDTLQKVDLSKNNWSDFPKIVCNWTSVRSLDISQNKMEAIPDQIGQLSHLEILNLERNRLEELPTSIGNLEALKRLYLRSNHFRSFPKIIGQLTNLEELEISLLGNNNPNNKGLEMPPECLSNLKKLQRIVIQRRYSIGEGAAFKKEYKSVLQQLVPPGCEVVLET